MKMKQIGEFLKKNVFYVAMGVVVIGALVAVYFIPNPSGNVDPSAYEPKKEASGKLASTDSSYNQALDQTEQQAAGVEESNTDEAVTEASDSQTPVANEEAATEEKNANVPAKVDEQAAADTQSVASETFDSTTADEDTPPYFAEGDTFVWPVEGKIVVPYTDENTKYWYSKALNQTMRTFGICISGEEGQAVKAIAKGTVIDILDDSSTLGSDMGMPYVGKVMIIDHGNGYKSIYGFQKGTPNKELKGQVVNVGDTLGTVGDPEGAFLSEGDNIYLQVTHNDKVIDPQTRLENQVQVSQNK